MTTVYLNGEFLPLENAKLSVLDRGFIFGDGVYEVLRAVDGRLFAARFHNQRLERSLEGIRIALDAGDSPTRFAEVGGELLRENGLNHGEAIVYMQVTRGATTRAHQFPSPPVSPTVYISVARFTPYTQFARDGATAITAVSPEMSRRQHPAGQRAPI